MSSSYYKIYQTAFNKENEEIIKNIFIFVGEQPKNVTAALAVLSKGDKLNKEEEKIIISRFGKNWQSELGIESFGLKKDKLQKVRRKSFKTGGSSEVDKQNGNMTNSKDKQNGNYKSLQLVKQNSNLIFDEFLEQLPELVGGQIPIENQEAQQELDFDVEERELDEDIQPETETETETYDEVPLDITGEIDQEISFGLPIDETETFGEDLELQKLIEEIDQEEVIEGELTSSPTIPLDLQLKIEVSKNKFNFIPTLIYPDDNIITLKNKIYAYSGIPLIAQNVFYLRENPYFEGDIEAVNYEYSIVNSKDKSKRYDATILNLYKTKTERNILGIPIDDIFIRLFDGSRTLIITDQTRDLVGSETNEIYVTSFLDIINFIDKAKIRDILVDDPSELYDFYNGFVVKYFPSIINSRGSLSALLLNEYKSEKNPGSLVKDFQKEQLQIMTIKNAKKISESPIKILSITVNINYPSETNIISKKRILNLRNLFDFYIPSNDVPYVKYKDREQGYVFHKTERNFYDENIGIVRGRWALTEPTGLVSFKVRQTGNKFATISVFEDGKIRIDTTWEEIEAATIKQVNALVEIVNEHIIDKINDLGLNVFVSRRRIEKTSIKIVTMNITSEINTELTDNDYRNLTLLTRVFKTFISLDIERKIDFEKNIYSVYWRYLKSPKYQFKGFRGRAISHNEIISNMLKPNNEFIYGLNVHLVDKKPKLFISGAKDFDEIKRVYDFILGLLSTYKEWMKGKNMNPLKQEFDQYIKLIKKPEENLGLSFRKKVKRIRRLQASDPNMFDFSTKKGKYQFYSRICQGEDRQPLIVTPDEAKKLPQSRILAIDNRSRPDTTNIYYCDDKIYKYPGLFQKEKHPDGFCLPCCFKTDFRDTSTPRNYKIYRQCMKDQSTVSTSISEDIDEKVGMNRYVKQWNKPIEEGRFGLLPLTIQEFFNADLKCKINRLSMIERNSSCFLTIGVLQDEKSFLRTVATSMINKTQVLLNKAERFQVAMFSNKLIEYLKDNSYIFPILQNGRVQREFETMDNYIKYLKDKFIVDDFTFDLVTKYNPEGQINIVLFKEYSDNSIKIQCQENTYNLIENLKDPTKKTIIIIKNEIKKQYFPIYFIKTDSSPIPKITVKRLFDISDNVIKKIIDLIRSVCEISENPKEMKRKYRDLFGVNIMIDSKFIPNEPYKIIGQILSDDLHTIQAIIIENKTDKEKFTFPVKYNSLQIPEIPFVQTTNVPLGSIEIITKFLNKIHETELKIRRYAIHNKKVVAIMLNSNYFVFIKPFDIKNIKRKDLELYTFKYDISTIDKYILNRQQLNDIRIDKAKQIKFDKDVFNTMVLELSHHVFNEKNKKIRDKIKKIIDKYELTTGNNYRQIIDEFTNLNVSVEDFNQLKELIQQFFINKDKKQFNNNFREMAFDFDHLIKQEVVNIINNKVTNKEKTKYIRKIIEEILKPIIIISKYKIQEGKEIPNVIQQCTDKKSQKKCTSPQCIWSESDGSCKIFMPKHLYEDYMQRISEELVRNDYMRLQILNNAVDIVLDRERFLSKENEVVFMTPIKK